MFGSYGVKTDEKKNITAVWLEGIGVELIEDFVEENLWRLKVIMMIISSVIKWIIFHKIQSRSFAILLIFSWISPSIQIFFFPAKLSVLLMRILGTFGFMLSTRKANGITAKDVPITNTKSASETILSAR